MLTESFIAATEAANKPSAHLTGALKDVGIFQYEFQPQTTFRQGYKKTSVKPNCLAVSRSHIFAAQANKAVVHVYNREKGNQEATVAFSDKICSIAYAQEATILVLGTEDGKLILWEIATGRVTASAASHLGVVSSLAITPKNDYIVSGSADSSVHVWGLGELISFTSPSQSYENSAPKNAPVRTFSNHRAGVTALATGHSRYGTNFVVSAGSDRTCYIWHIETCQVLRTFLTPANPTSVVLDPADRAVYLGNEDGTINSIDLFSGPSQKSKTSIYDITESTPIQLTAADNWSAASTNHGAANCLTLSYDGMTLLSGHMQGNVIRWDVAKHRIVSEIASLNQPVNYIQMLVPDGLQIELPRLAIPHIVKPRLEMNAESVNNTIEVPASYSFTAQIAQNKSSVPGLEAVAAVLNGALFSDDMLDDAIQAMNAKSMGVSNGISQTTGSNKSDTYKIQTLEEENLVLEKKVAVLRKLHEEAQERHRRRSEQRHKVGQQRREAYFAAKKKGKDGDEAMKPFDRKLEAINIESDEEELSIDRQMEID